MRHQNQALSGDPLPAIFSFFATIDVATTSPKQLLKQTNIPTKGPSPATMVTASAGTPNSPSSIDIMMVAEPGTPGAPMDNIMIESARDRSALAGTGTSNAFARVSDCTASEYVIRA